MSLPKGPSLSLVEATETEITVQFAAMDGHSTYEMQWKEVQAPWEGGSQSKTIPANGNTNKAVASNLNPGTSYCIRMLVVAGNGDTSAKGEPGKELIIDTEQVGCTPKAEKSCCVIQ